MQQKLEQITGNRITRKSLRDSIMKTNKARAEFRRLYNLRKAMPPMIYGKDAFIVANAYFFDDIHTWTGAITRLNNELEEKAKRAIAL